MAPKWLKLIVVDAASSEPSSVVTIDPVRILDTREGVGLGGNPVFAHSALGQPYVSQRLQVTGAVPTTEGVQTPVPVGATGVLLNVTVVNPTVRGLLSVRPGDATGEPTTSSLNFEAGDRVPNAVQVGLPTSGEHAGRIDISYEASCRR